MHFLLVYHFEIPEPDCIPIKEKISVLLQEYEHLEIFQNAHVIKIKEQKDWDKIRQSMSSIASICGCDLKYIMTPANLGGSYAGWLLRGNWPIIKNLITENNG